MFIILESAGAKLTIAESRNKTTVISVADYLYFNMEKKIILNIILPALNPKAYAYRSYKVIVDCKLIFNGDINSEYCRLCHVLKTLMRT